MQTWHCIALIIISVAVFFYASFMDEIEERSKSSLLDPYEAPILPSIIISLEPETFLLLSKIKYDPRPAMGNDVC